MVNFVVVKFDGFVLVVIDCDLCRYYDFCSFLMVLIFLRIGMEIVVGFCGC